MIEVNEALSIPESELGFTASRSSGPGGQHVNKVSTRVTLQFDCLRSPSLSESQRRRILSRLAGRINRDGVLRMRCQRHRSQAANREELLRRFAGLLRETLAPRKPRLRTRPSSGAVQRRLEQKRQRSVLKRVRAKRVSDDD